jgi:hypothetical protein
MTEARALEIRSDPTFSAQRSAVSCSFLLSTIYYGYFEAVRELALALKQSLDCDGPPRWRTIKRDSRAGLRRRIVVYRSSGETQSRAPCQTRRIWTVRPWI